MRWWRNYNIENLKKIGFSFLILFKNSSSTLLLKSKLLTFKIVARKLPRIPRFFKILEFIEDTSICVKSQINLENRCNCK